MAEAYPSSQIRHFRLNSSGTGPTSLFDEISQTNFQCGEYSGDNFNGFARANIKNLKKRFFSFDSFYN